ncbi:MAG TPA: HEAT repeat domain-containing protein [Candidatus Deferrimicrobiaceae bacterium]
MAVEQRESVFPEVERLLLDLARVCHWTGLYQAGHPFLAERIKQIHAALVARIAQEPGNRLLFGIARDRVLYRDAFLGEGHALISPFAENLYINQVATLGFSGDATAEGLLSFFRSLHDSRSGKSDESPEAFLQRERLPGIFLYPYNYKEVLSRRIVNPEESVELSGRGDTLWRMLLTANIADEGGERKVVEELSGSPELIPAILRHAQACAQKGPGPPGTHANEDAVSPEVLRRMFRRLGDTMRSLPEDRRQEVLHFLDEGTAWPDGPADEEQGGAELSLPVSFARSLSADYTDDDFLDLTASLLSAEDKGGKRLRRIFEIIAAERDVHGSLLPRLKERARESLRAKEYYAVKTWEAVEKLLLARSEKAYAGEDHSRFMEALSAGAGMQTGAVPSAEPDPTLLEHFREEARHRKAVLVLLELLAREKNDAEFLQLLEDIRKYLPNIISRMEFALLETVLGALSSISENAAGAGRDEVRRTIQGTDFGHIVDLFLSRAMTPEDEERIPAFFAAFGEDAIAAVLDRLLTEPEAGKRKLLLSLGVRMGRTAVPAILDRLSHPRWYFVRNLCFLLGELGDRAAGQELVRTLDNTDLRVKREAVLALGKLKVPEAVPSLGRILLAEAIFASTKEVSLRLDAATAIFRIGGAEATGFLHRGKESRRAAVREHCAALLKSTEGR